MTEGQYDADMMLGISAIGLGTVMLVAERAFFHSHGLFGVGLFFLVVGGFSSWDNLRKIVRLTERRERLKDVGDQTF